MSTEPATLFEKMGTFETKWGPNGDPKRPKGPHWGPGSPIGDPSGSSGDDLGEMTFMQRWLGNDQKK